VFGKFDAYKISAEALKITSLYMSFVAHPTCYTVREELWYMKNNVVIGM
jgi:hypothetical protein